MSNPIHDSSNVQSILDLKDALESLPSTSRLSNSDTEAIYALGHQLVVQGRYETAYRYFSLLTLYKPTHTAYLQGLALCYRMLERYDEALNVYSFLATVDTDNLDHGIAIVECLLLKREFDEAKHNVELVLQYCKENAAADTKAAERAQVLMDLLCAPVQGAQGAVAAGA
ncbi:tetratricopeptide repeat protein [Acidovorax sp.]|uniref:tetratricopeptide repeat protein n=1 Tax=Acidovorax sp. TaxID=1872122 RepID=UPI003D03032C